MKRPAPLRGLSPLSLMLPLNHTDTPPVSICEAAPVPYVSLWGTEQTSQSITGEKTELWGGNTRCRPCSPMRAWPQLQRMPRWAQGEETQTHSSWSKTSRRWTLTAGQSKRSILSLRLHDRQIKISNAGLDRWDKGGVLIWAFSFLCPKVLLKKNQQSTPFLLQLFGKEIAP